MSLTLIVAEKPSVAKDLARVLGLKGKAPDHFHGMYQGQVFQVSWAVGHLVGIAEPEIMNPLWKAWNQKSLPMIPREWRLQVIDSGKSQFKKLCSLFNQKDLRHVICATDAGREGELIFRYIADAAKLRVPVTRLWISSLTDEAILKGMKVLRPQKDFDHLYESARCRSRADWLVGMNFTRYYTLGSGKLFSVGRVQTPTLALIAKRTAEVERFSSQAYYEILAKFTHAVETGYYLGCLKEILSFPEKSAIRQLADEAPPVVGQESSKTKKNSFKFVDLASCQSIETDLAGATGLIASSDTKLKSIPPPELFDLTELQREANKRFHFTADKTLKLAQALYERHKVISYPRTDSRHLTEDVAKDLVKRMEQVKGEYPGLDFEFKIPGSRYINPAKVTDHHAIIPVAKSGALSGDERRLFDLIFARSLQIFLSPRLVHESRIVTDVLGLQGSYVFHSQSTHEIDPGWTALEKQFFTLKSAARRSPKGEGTLHSESSDMESEAENFQVPSWALPQEKVKGIYRIEKKQTTPPKLYTDASLLSAMEYCGRTVEDQQLKEALKASGIGTPATRAQTIELLITRKYVTRKGKALLVTHLGQDLIGMVHPSLKSVELTGSFEKGLELVRQGKVSSEEFEEKIRLLITRILPFEGAEQNRPMPHSMPHSMSLALEAQGGSLYSKPQASSQRASKSDDLENLGETDSRSLASRKETTTRASRGSSAHPMTLKSESSSEFLEPQQKRQLESSHRVRTSESSPSRGNSVSALATEGRAPLEILTKVFGLDGFRTGQDEVISALMQGRDALVLMPTGGGKSLCFQIPGLAKPGVALVISPLLALMDDQVRRLRLHGIAAFALHSGLSRDEQFDLWQRLEQGQVKFLFVSPEKMASASFRSKILSQKLSLVAIDEAHCVSQWGHDFRPDYREFPKWIQEVRPAPVIALTATATQKVSLDIAKVLNLSQPLIHVGGFYRHNLAIEVHDVSKSDRIFIAQKRLQEKNSLPAIVYVSSRKDTELYATFLGKTFRSAPYHAGMTAERRNSVQADFIESRIDIVVATVAFGMGIDKSNIRTVIHMSLPSSIESYYQEIGRAGRDGEHSRCLLLKSKEDRDVLDWMYRENYPSIAVLEKTLKSFSRDSGEDKSKHSYLDKLLIHGAIFRTNEGKYEISSSPAWKTSYLKQADARSEQIRAIEGFAGVGSTCRMVKLTSYFGQSEQIPCQICDLCTGAVKLASPRGQDLGFHIMDYIRRYGKTAFGKLKGELAKGHKVAHSTFESILQGMALDGFLKIEEETFMAGGKKIFYRSVAVGPKASQFSSENPPQIHRQSFEELSYSSFTSKSPKKGKRKSYRSKATASSLMVKRVLKKSAKPKKT
ncbi:MAG: RecQ family ATP-dependent DNA helicase [Pseudomonadota bacterium]